MIFFIIIMIIILAILTGYLILLQAQIRNMSVQLEKRLREHSQQPISIELFNSNLNLLARKINESLKAEETLRLNGIREEKRFKETIADISHDLRTPLTAIKGYQQLLDHSELNAEQRKKLHIAMKHSDELGHMIERFFEYSYLLNTESKMQLEHFNITKLLMECLVAAVTALEERGIKIIYEEKPPIDTYSDREKVTRIIQNLIRNCIVHSCGDIKVRIDKEDSSIQLSFQNRVKEPEHIDISRIFDRFYTGDRARSHSTGLGLSIVKILTEQVGGRVNAYLEAGDLEIRITLPVNAET